MAANQDTAIQVNYKLPDGTLINLYAKDPAHLEALLTAVADTTTLISATASALGANATPAAAISYAKVALGATEVDGPELFRNQSICSEVGLKGIADPVCNCPLYS